MKRRTASPPADPPAAPVACSAVRDRVEAGVLKCWCGLTWEARDPSPPMCPLNGEREIFRAGRLR